MGLPVSVKKKLKPLLAKPYVGRPLHLILWLALRLSEFFDRGIQLLRKPVLWFHRKASSAFYRIPHVRDLIQRDSFDGDASMLLAYYRQLASLCGQFPLRPKFSVLIPVYKVKPAFLRETLASVAFQCYPDWEICIVDDCSNDPAVTAVLEEFQAKYGARFRYVLAPENGHISVTSNRCLALATGEYVALLDHDDRLYPNALAEMLRYINLHDAPDILYSDERNCDADGFPLNDPYFKPDWSPFMHLSMNYTTHLSVYRTELVRQVGGFRKGFEGSQDHDLMLRMVEASPKPVVHVPFCLYQWRAHPGSTALSIDSKPYAAIAGEKAVLEACQRRGRPAEVNYETWTMHYRVKFALPAPNPLVSIIIPTRNGLSLLSRCLDSITRLSTYVDYEILIVDNGSDDPETLAYLRDFTGALPTHRRVLHAPGPFNFGALNNRAVQETAGEYVLLLNNDTEVRSPDWIQEMLRLAQFPEVGAVGAKLLYSSGQIQHSGVVLAAQDIAFHSGLLLPSTHGLYCHVMNTVHECAAVTAACLLISKKKYLEVGGLDQLMLPNGYGDVDFCLKLLEKGYSNLYTPYAELFHHESQSRKQSIENFEQTAMQLRWGKLLLRDPYLNPNLNYSEFFNINPKRMKLEVGGRLFQYLLETPPAEWNPEEAAQFKAMT